ncbi:MAG: transcriptional regulator, partial [Spirochaetaceae bacterium]|nr:transcriptional regulator [Spirochaetaceae bacterium]
MDGIKRQASDDFSKARAKEIFSQIKHFLHTGRNTLLSLEDVKKILRPKNETYAGIRAVPIKLIVGSEGRYRDF